MTKSNINPYDLREGDIIRPTGRGWYSRLRENTYPIRIRDDGQAVFEADHDEWVADESDEWRVELVEHAEPVDAINPAHYRHGIEVADFIEEYDLDFRLGNVVKYVARHKAKGNPLQDLKKAQWYLTRAITLLEKTQ